MKLKTLLLVMLAMNLITQPETAKPGKTSATAAQTESKTKSKSNEQVDSKYLGYSVDGRTSASVLAAQRSHTVAGKDERNFAIFTGIVVIFIIIFFSKIEFYDK